MPTNTLTPILPKILARGMMGLRSRVLMTRLVNLDYSTEAKKKGSTIDVPISSARTATDVSPAATSPDPTAVTSATVQIPLNNWQKSNFGLTDNDLNKIYADEHFIPLEMGECFEALAAAINASVFAEYKGVYGYTGTAGTTPFGPGVTVTSATDLRKILNQQKAPLVNRRGVLNFDAEAAALALSQFSDAEKVGGSDVKINGEIGRKFGIDWNADDAVPTHTAGTITTGLIAKASTTQAVGTKAITCTTAASTGACALLVGDIITFAGHSQTYVLTANATQASAATDVTVNIEPGLTKALTGSEAVTVKASHVVNLGFHRDAFALAMRAPDAGLKEIIDVANTVTLADPVSGLVMRLEVIRQYKQVLWEVDCMWGAKLVRPEFASRLAG